MLKVYPSVADLPKQYNSDATKGLTNQQVALNRQKYGSNALSPIPQEPLWKLFLEKFKDTTIIILCVAALVSLAAGLHTGHYIDGIAILAAVFIATLVGFVNEYKSNKEFELLNKVSDNIRVKVSREGHFHTVTIDELVVGDIVHIYTGDKIPADGKLLQGIELMVNQSLLTGESEHIHKDENDTTLYRGTTITEGNGLALVTAVGDATEVGKIKDQLVGNTAPTPLQERLDELAGSIGKAGTAAALFTFFALTGVALFQGNIKFDATGFETILQFFIVAITIVVVAVPEGLPLAVTVSLAFSMQRMAKDKTLVRKLSACETIGATNVICSDKTGTLTKNQMAVQRLLFNNQAYEMAQLKDLPQDALFKKLALSIAANSTGNLEEREGRTQFVGNPTECALLLLLRQHQISYEVLREEHSLIQRISFSSQRKTMITVIEMEHENSHLVLVKGSPEKILSLCTSYETTQGVAPLGNYRAKIEQELEFMTNESMRTIALAYKPIDHPENDRQFEKDLIFLALIGIADPVREDVKVAIDVCRVAGVDVKMLTGDNLKTATAIAKELGLIKEGGLVLDGEAFQKLSDAQLLEQAPKINVLARSTPLDKLRLVNTLKQLRNVVAVTGDGTNDAPALKQADVGLSMGTGTDIAKEASDIVLLDDSFSSIVRAINWGRSLYENIQKFVQFQLTVNVAALAIAFFGALFGFGLPLTAIQLLWVNLIMDTLAALALGLEPPTEDVMQHLPRQRDASIITSKMWSNIIFTASYFFIVLMLMLKFNIFDCQTTRERETVIFTVFVFFQIWNEINCRALSPQRSCFKGIWDSKYFLNILIVIIVVQIIITQFGGEIFRTTPLSLIMWLKIILLTSSVLVISELRRIIERRFRTPEPVS